MTLLVPSLRQRKGLLPGNLPSERKRQYRRSYNFPYHKAVKGTRLTHYGVTTPTIDLTDTGCEADCCEEPSPPCICKLCPAPNDLPTNLIATLGSICGGLNGSYALVGSCFSTVNGDGGQWNTEPLCYLGSDGNYYTIGFFCNHPIAVDVFLFTITKYPNSSCGPTPIWSTSATPEVGYSCNPANFVFNLNCPETSSTIIVTVTE